MRTAPTRTGTGTGAPRAIRPTGTPRTIRGIAAAIAVLASGPGAPGLTASAMAQTQGNFAVEFAPYAVTSAIQGPSADAVDVSRLPAPLDPSATNPGQPAGSGIASWYGNELKGHRTASGERFDPSGYTAAHRSLPLGSKVRVTNVQTGESVIVRINDRGPFTRSRVIDLSQATARDLGVIGHGEVKVSLAVLDSTGGN